MAYKPTGRPVGRPKTKDYEIFSFKVPTDLITRVKAYAHIHHQSVAELIRDGLEWRITEDDPRAHMVYEAPPVPAAPATPNGTSSPTPAPRVPAAPVAAETPPPPAAPVPDVVPRGSAPRSDVSDASPFDATKYRLGDLCKRKHAYAGTGQTLYQKKRRVCPECDRIDHQAKRDMAKSASGDSPLK